MGVLSYNTTICPKSNFMGWMGIKLFKPKDNTGHHCILLSAEFETAVVLLTYYKFLFHGMLIMPDPEVIKLFSCSTQLSMKF